jgi:hypothetical protein
MDRKGRATTQPPSSHRVGVAWATGAFVFELPKRAGDKPCPLQGPDARGGEDRPVQGDPGLIAYECPSCGYVTSDLTPNPQPPGK